MIKIKYEYIKESHKIDKYKYILLQYFKKTQLFALKTFEMGSYLQANIYFKKHTSFYMAAIICVAQDPKPEDISIPLKLA